MIKHTRELGSCSKETNEIPQIDLSVMLDDRLIDVCLTCSRKYLRKEQGQPRYFMDPSLLDLDEDRL